MGLFRCQVVEQELGVGGELEESNKAVCCHVFSEVMTLERSHTKF